ncbi:hypothetical protein QT971_20345 [Microcoleus sp. herbarium19]|uniref:hypothetical protein n=1 Tax=unclassified Microcoleus TaxID=2642155 RepID=UPI002FD16E6F
MTIRDRATGSQGITFVNNKTITITKRTIRFSHNVYLFDNIEGFSEEVVDIETIPFWIITILFMIGVIISSSNLTLGWTVTILPILGTIWNLYKPKYYGLLLTFNSGNKFLFVTTDRSGTKNVISVIYEFFETKTEEDLAVEISISNSRISINNIYRGFVGGNVFGDVVKGIYTDDK